MPRVYTNAERPLRGGKAVRDTLCSWTGGHGGYGHLHISTETIPKHRSQTQTSANILAGTDSPGGGGEGGNIAQSWMLTVTQKPPKSQTRRLLQCFLKTSTSISKAQRSLEPGGLGFPLTFAQRSHFEHRQSGEPTPAVTGCPLHREGECKILLYLSPSHLLKSMGCQHAFRALLNGNINVLLCTF